MSDKRQAVVEYIESTQKLMMQIHGLMQVGEIQMSEQLWNVLEDQIESKHLNYHPLVSEWMDED